MKTPKLGTTDPKVRPQTRRSGFDTRAPIAKPSKTVSAEWDREWEAKFPIVARLRTGLSTFTTILDTGDEAGLDPFIRTDQNEDSEPIAESASGLKPDIASVKNGLNIRPFAMAPWRRLTTKSKWSVAGGMDERDGNSSMRSSPSPGMTMI